MNTALRPQPSQQAIVEAVAALRAQAVDDLCELVRHPSLLGQEDSAQAVMARHFAELGLEVKRVAIDEDKLRRHPAYSPSIVSYAGRENVVGTHRPAGPAHGRSLILNGHIDVVPVGADVLWASPPFAPRVEGDRLYGRGAGDMKAGLVGNLVALRALRALGFEPAATVHLQSVIEEECTGNGALACLLEGYRADAALIPEPTGESVMSGQMGVSWLALEVYGVPVHVAQAYTGVSAIEFVQYLVGELRALERRWNEPSRRHRLYCQHPHPINFNLGKITGGEWASSVPTHCRAELRIGYFPGVKPADALAEVQQVLREAHARHPQASHLRLGFEFKGFQSEGLEVDLDQPVIQTLMQCHRDLLGQAAEAIPMTATTDVKFFHLYGDIPATCYGPSSASIHGIDEWVSIDSMMRVATVYALFMARWCGLNAL